MLKTYMLDLKYFPFASYARILSCSAGLLFTPAYMCAQDAETPDVVNPASEETLVVSPDDLDSDTQRASVRLRRP